MRRDGLLNLGIVGTAIIALCCFTPVLAALLGVLGLSALTGTLDYVLLPALIFFVGLTIYALRRRKAASVVAKKMDLNHD